MQLFNKLQDQYDQLWKHIIRPARTSYPETQLGPQVFQLQGIKVKRSDFQIVNQKGLLFYGSHFVPMQLQSYPCVIYLHGNSSNRTQGMQYLGELIKNNISLCTFDFTGCGNAQGQYVSLGYHEWKDLADVYTHMKEKQKVTQVGLWGRSMGAVTTLRYLKMNTDIKVAIMDSPFKSLKQLIIDLCKKNSKIPALILSGALKIISSTIKEKADFDVYDLNPLKNEAPYIKTPGFFIVGEQDQLIPPQHTKELFSQYKTKKKQLRVVSGQHNTQRPEACISDAVNFLKKYLFPKQKKQKLQESPSSKVQEIDFFDFDVEDEKPASSTAQQESVDFFNLEDNTHEMKEENQKAFENFEFSEQTEEKKKEEQNNFSLSDMFQGVFSGKNKKQKKAIIIDGYEELRNKLKGIFTPNDKDSYKKQKEKEVKKELKNYDDSFEKLFENESQRYVWT